MKKKWLIATIFVVFLACATLCYAGWGMVDTEGFAYGNFTYTHGDPYDFGPGNYAGGISQGNGFASYDGSGFLFATGGAEYEGVGSGISFDTPGAGPAMSFSFAKSESNSYFAGLGCGNVESEANAFQQNWAGTAGPGGLNFAYGGNWSSANAGSHDSGFLLTSTDSEALAFGGTIVNVSFTPNTHTSFALTGGGSLANCDTYRVDGSGFVSTQSEKYKPGKGLAQAGSNAGYNYSGNHVGGGFAVSNSITTVKDIPNGVKVSAKTKSKAAACTD